MLLWTTSQSYSKIEVDSENKTTNKPNNPVKLIDRAIIEIETKTPEQTEEVSTSQIDKSQKHRYTRTKKNHPPENIIWNPIARVVTRNKARSNLAELAGYPCHKL